MAKLGEILRPRPRTDQDPLDPAEEAYRARIAERVAWLSGSATAEAGDAAAPLGEPSEAMEGGPGLEPEHVVDGFARPAEQDLRQSSPLDVVEPQRFSVPLLAGPHASFVGAPGTLFDPYPADPALIEPEVRMFTAEPDAIHAVVFADPTLSVEAVVAVEADDGWTLPGTGDRESPAATLVEAFTEGPEALTAAEVAPSDALADGPDAHVAATDASSVIGVMTPAPPVRRRAVPPARGTEAAPTPSEPAERAPDPPRVRRRPVARSTPRPRRVPDRISPYCPSCAVLLEPPPAASRRCVTCGQRIIVRHVDGRTVYLAQSSLPVFEAERRRRSDAERFTRERARWLTLASAAGAPAERAARLAAAPPSEKSSAGARALYLTSVERAFQAARRDRRWVDAARIRREQVTALYRAIASPVPPPAEILGLHRDAVAAELRGIAEIARDAELVGATCCDTCRADDGHVSRIAIELRAPRLPHDGCPRGLCRCRWDLGARHKTTVERYLRRRERGGSRPDPVDPQTT
jgi:hypothetical protein